MLTVNRLLNTACKIIVENVEKRNTEYVRDIARRGRWRQVAIVRMSAAVTCWTTNYK